MDQHNFIPTGWRRIGLPAAASLVALGLLGACGGSSGPSPAEQDATAKQQAAVFATYTRPDTHGTLYQPDLLVPMRDGFQLTCDLYRPAAPDGTVAAGKFPSLLINFTSYGRTFLDYGTDLRDFSKKGYTVMWCNTRGSQGVGGASPSRPESVAPVNPFSPQEGQDNYDVIEWIAAQPWSTGNVGQVGSSYGGITSLRVAGLAPPHLKAIIPGIATHDMYRHFFTAGGLRISTTGDARGFWPPACSTVTGEATCSDRIPAEWDSHPTYDDYWAARTANLGAIKAATLFVSGVKDFWIQAHDERFAVMGERENVATVIGPWQHDSLEVRNPELKNMYLAWFDKWVAEMHTAPLPPKALAQGIQSAGTNAWDGFAAWPPRSSENQVFFLSASGLQKDAPGNGTLQFTIAADGTSSGLTVATQPFSAATTLAGPIEVNLPLSFTASDANLIVNIQSLGTDGTSTDLGYATYRKASHLESDGSPSARVPGRTYQFKMIVPSKYWSFKPGERMVLTVTSSDAIVVSNSPAGTVTVSLGPDALVRAPMLPR